MEPPYSHPIKIPHKSAHNIFQHLPEFEHESFNNSPTSQLQLAYVQEVKRLTPRLYTPTNNCSPNGRSSSRGHSPGVQSSGDRGSNSSVPLIITDGTLSSSTGSQSITPPNSNSNTTISCGSGNSLANHNNNLIKLQTELESLRNKSKPKAKKCILEEDEDDIDKCMKIAARKRHSWVMPMPSPELLPVCDALFNFISLALYFCDIVFDVLTVYTWHRISQETDDFLILEDDEAEEKRRKASFMFYWSITAMFFIVLSAIISQTLSFKWYKQSTKRGHIAPDGSEIEGPPPPCSTLTLVTLHVSLCGVLWRYFKLFIPVDPRFVKNEVRDLCVLRLVHAFCEAVPMLLMQLYLIWGLPGPESLSDFTIVSASLSLCSVCWALASFSKNIRKRNVHKLVLTWLGVVLQFLWHLATVTARVIALSLYATVYHFWIFLVLCLHWLCMLLWLLSPKNMFQGEKIPAIKKVMYGSLLAVVYTFCYINVQKGNSRQKVMIYYLTMFSENCLLLTIWLIAKRYEDEIWYRSTVIYAVVGCFGAGMFFMCLYYRITKPIISITSSPTKEVTGHINGLGMVIANGGFKHKKNPELYLKQNELSHVNEEGDLGPVGGQKGVLSNKIKGHHIHHPNVPGVFNCRFHPAMKRKKKKPTSFIPPAVQSVHVISPDNNSFNKPTSNPTRGLQDQSHHLTISPNSDNGQFKSVSRNFNHQGGRMSHPFWKRPLSASLGSENEGSGGSRNSKIDIQQKLQEKKQQQLAELKEIEEEIKQGKLKRPEFNEIPQPVTACQPIPVEKKKPWIKTHHDRVHDDHPTTGPPLYIHAATRPQLKIPQDPNANEVLLDPQYLMYSSPHVEGSEECCYYYDNPEWAVNFYEPEPPCQNDEIHEPFNGSGIDRIHTGKRNAKNRSSKESLSIPKRMSSDGESQSSVPKCYTLPQEQKLNKRKHRKPIKSDQFVPSTNSSDGDVDSGGDQDHEVYGTLGPYPLPLPPQKPLSAVQPNKSGQKLHETKL